VEWKIRVPSLGIDLALRTRLKQQELTSPAKKTSAYWEGAIEVDGTRQGRKLSGSGYLEMTGYAGSVFMGQ
jgi:predicted secreted hydrolase